MITSSQRNTLAYASARPVVRQRQQAGRARGLALPSAAGAPRQHPARLPERPPQRAVSSDASQGALEKLEEQRRAVLQQWQSGKRRGARSGSQAAPPPPPPPQHPSAPTAPSAQLAGAAQEATEQAPAPRTGPADEDGAPLVEGARKRARRATPVAEPGAAFGAATSSRADAARDSVRSKQRAAEAPDTASSAEASIRVAPAPARVDSGQTRLPAPRVPAPGTKQATVSERPSQTPVATASPRATLPRYQAGNTQAGTAPGEGAQGAGAVRGGSRQHQQFTGTPGAGAANGTKSAPAKAAGADLKARLRRARGAYNVWALVRRLVRAGRTRGRQLRGPQEPGSGAGLSPGHVLLLQLSNYRPTDLNDTPAQIGITSVPYNACYWTRDLNTLTTQEAKIAIQRLSLQQICYILAALAAARHPCPPHIAHALLTACIDKLTATSTTHAGHTEDTDTHTVTVTDPMQGQGYGETRPGFNSGGSKGDGAASQGRSKGRLLGRQMGPYPAGCLAMGLLRLHVEGRTAGAHGSMSVTHGEIEQLRREAGRRLEKWLQAWIDKKRSIPAAKKQQIRWLVRLAWCLANLRAQSPPPPRPTTRATLTTHQDTTVQAAETGAVPTAVRLAGLSAPILTGLTRVTLAGGARTCVSALGALDALRLAAVLAACGAPPGAPVAGARDAAQGKGISAGVLALRPSLQLAVRAAVRQAHKLVGQLPLAPLAAALAVAAAGQELLLEEAHAAVLFGTRARRYVSFMQRMSKLIRARVHRFKQRELVVILNSLVLVYSQRDRVPAAGQLDMLWLDEVARWTANKMFNASPSEAVQTLTTLSSIGWYNPWWWDKAGRYLIRLSTHTMQTNTPALSIPHIRDTLAAYARVGHTHTGLLTHLTELLMMHATTPLTPQHPAHTPQSRSAGRDPDSAMVILASLVRLGYRNDTVYDMLADRVVVGMGEGVMVGGVAGGVEGLQPAARIAALAAGCAALGHAPRALLDAAVAAAVSARALSGLQQPSAAARAAVVRLQAGITTNVCYALLVPGASTSQALTTHQPLFDMCVQALVSQSGGRRKSPLGGAAGAVACGLLVAQCCCESLGGQGGVRLGQLTTLLEPGTEVRNMRAWGPSIRAWWRTGVGPGMSSNTPLPTPDMRTYASRLTSALNKLGKVKTIPPKAEPNQRSVSPTTTATNPLPPQAQTAQSRPGQADALLALLASDYGPLLRFHWEPNRDLSGHVRSIVRGNRAQGRSSQGGGHEERGWVVELWVVVYGKGRPAAAHFERAAEVDHVPGAAPLRRGLLPVPAGDAALRVVCVRTLAGPGTVVLPLHVQQLVECGDDKQAVRELLARALRALAARPAAIHT